MAITREIMQQLVQEYDLVPKLTEKLSEVQERYPEMSHYAGWHPKYFYDYLCAEVFSEETVKLVAQDDFWDTSFVKEFKEVEDVLYVEEYNYPALVKELGGGWCVLTVDFCKRHFSIIEKNANALAELAKVLIEKGVEPWFEVPEPVEAGATNKREAILQTLFDLSQEKPKKFLSMVKDNLYASGYVKESVTNKEIKKILEGIVDDIPST